MIRSKVSGALFACSVARTRWPVPAISIADCIDSQRLGAEVGVGPRREAQDERGTFLRAAQVVADLGEVPQRPLPDAKGKFAMADFDPAGLTYDEKGLIPAIAQDAASGEVLMMAWMNAEALARTLETGRVTYWSRSRQAFWVKGESSGHVQELVDLRVDCDRDCLLLQVRQTGPACHTNRRSCFYTAVRDGAEVELMRPE